MASWFTLTLDTTPYVPPPPPPPEPHHHHPPHHPGLFAPVKAPEQEVIFSLPGSLTLSTEFQQKIPARHRAAPIELTSAGYLRIEREVRFATEGARQASARLSKISQDDELMLTLIL